MLTIVASNVVSNGKLHSTIRIYDSALQAITLETKKALCALLKTRKDMFHFDLMNTQLQSNSNDCGLFAVAFATELVCGGDPTRCRFIEGELRRHLLKCLENHVMSRFPSKPRRISFGGMVKSSVAETIYCVCRMVNDPSQVMIECGTCYKWFHTNCVGLETNKSYKALKWNCQTCGELFK